jgi:pyridinium-3,5-biscarboxylic acid mononucleotide synthase
MTQMDADRLTQLLTAVQDGRLSVAEVVAQWPDQAGGVSNFAVLDHGRAGRTGMPEVVFCQGKTPEQVVAIVGRLLTNEGRALATRASVETAEAVLAAYPQARWQQAARVIALGDAAAPPCAEDTPFVAVVTAGTSDIPVAEEAALTLEFLGHCVRRVYDVGVAGIHRLMHRLDVLREAQVIIAAAGMEGALASVLGGLVACPVVAVPTSVGYGASFGGLAALLAMLNSCAPGVAVVNIDNGFGAAVHAHQIMRSIRNDPS